MAQMSSPAEHNARTGSNEEPLGIASVASPGLGQSLVFVIGCPRSGTTWVQRLLGAHPRIRIGQESFLFNNYVAPQMRAWRFEQRRERNPAIASGRGGVGLSAHLREEQFLSRLKSYSDTLLEPMMAELQPGELYVDKSPGHARCIPEIKQLYPAARFIHVLRDPRDVAASWSNAASGWGRGWSTSSVKRPVQQWLLFVSTVRQAERWLNSCDFYEVRYERLSAEPEMVISELSRFLGLDWAANEIHEAVTENRVPSLRAGGGVRIPIGGEVAKRTGNAVMNEPPGFVGIGRPGAWRTSLSLLEKAQIWRQARRLMRREWYQWQLTDWLRIPRVNANRSALGQVQPR